MSGTTDPDLAEARRQRDLLRIQSDIKTLREDLKGKFATGESKQDPVGEIETSFMRGQKLRAFREGLGGDGVGPVVSKADLDRPVTVKDMLELVKATNGGKSDSAAETARVMIEALKVGMQQNSQKGADPVSTFTEALKVIQPLIDRANAANQTILQNEISQLKDRLASADPVARVREIKELSAALGLGQTDKDVTLKQLELQNAERQREFDWGRTKWEKEMEVTREDRKARAQEKMYGGILKGVNAMLESPVIREAGKAVGGKLKVPGADIRTKAAQSQLANPLAEQFSLDCAGCKSHYVFTAADLIKVRETQDGKWQCGRCGEVYSLKDEDKGPKPA